MEPARIGYLIPGTHAFAFPASAGPAVRIFVQAPEHVIAERFSRVAHHGERASAVVREWLGDNPKLILNQAPLADLIIDGTAARAEQVSRFFGAMASFFGLTDGVNSTR